MQICSKTQEFTQNSREIGQKTQFSGKSATLCLPENRPIKKPALVSSLEVACGFKYKSNHRDKHPKT